MKKGKFIVFEGIDGCGKSTQTKLLHEALHKRNLTVFLSAEPTNNLIGRIIKQAFSGEVVLNNLSIAGLFVADRLDHILNPNYGLLHKLEKCDALVCDRYYLSSLAYQSVFGSMEWIESLNSKAMDLLKPDLTFYLDIDPKISMERIHSKRSTKDIYETFETLQQVHQNYQKSINKYSSSDNIVIIDATLTVDSIHEIIVEKVTRLIQA